VLIYALIAVYAERKIAAFIQDRLGPMETGPLGMFQTLADVLKLVLKEAIVPTEADKKLFLLAPAMIFVAVFAGFAVMPIGPGLASSVTDIALLYILGIVAIDIIGILMAGWSSSNKYALLGAGRAIAQIVSYEIPAALALLVAILMYGSMDLQELSSMQGIYSQEPVYFLGIWDVTETGGFLSWSIFRYPHLILAYGIYFVASLAECNRAPFDIPEAESELVAGYHVEYGGFQFALIMLSEYMKMWMVGMIAAIVFLGGWNTPLPNLAFSSDFTLALADWTSGPAGTLGGAFWGAFWLIGKSLLAVFVHMWIRWTYPRFRVDQLMKLCWKVLTPAALVLFLISSIWKLWEVYQHI